MYFSTPLTVKEAAAALGCDKSTVYALCRTQQLKAFSVSRRTDGKNKTWRIPPEAIKEYRERGY